MPYQLWLHTSGDISCAVESKVYLHHSSERAALGLPLSEHVLERFARQVAGQCHREDPGSCQRQEADELQPRDTINCVCFALAS